MSLDIEVSNDGYKVLRINKNDKKIYLGSKYSQKREIEKFLNKFKQFTNKDNFIILGLSFGEHIEQLLKLINENSRILIVEFDTELIEYCKNDDNIKKIIDNDKVMIVNKKDEIERFFTTYINELNVDKVRVEEYSGYERMYDEELQEIYFLIRNSIAGIKLNRNTYRVFGELFLNNILSNLKYIAKSTEINQLKDAYENKPAIIVSAGPSLVKNIDNLKGLDNALILSGGRTLGALLERNINPSCIGVVDPGEVSYKLVEPYIKEVNCPLILTDLCNDRIIREHKSSKFFYTDSEFIADVWGESIKCLYGGGSIAHSLTNLAIYMGCNPIIFIGQDLAYTGEKGHASFCGNRWDELTFEQYKQNSDIYVKDIYGDPVKTSILLNDYRIALEKIIKESTHIKFINATEGGANIDGTENRKLEDALKELKKEIIVPMGNFSSNVDKTQDFIKGLENNLNLIKEYSKLCKNAKRYLKDYRKNYLIKNQKGVAENIKKLDEIDKEIINKNIEISLITTVITKIIYEIENDDEFIVNSSDSKNVIFNKEANRSEKLYSKMESFLNTCYDEIKKIINELKKEC